MIKGRTVIMWTRMQEIAMLRFDKLLHPSPQYFFVYLNPNSLCHVLCNRFTCHDAATYKMRYNETTLFLGKWCKLLMTWYILLGKWYKLLMKWYITLVKWYLFFGTWKHLTSLTIVIIGVCPNNCIPLSSDTISWKFNIYLSMVYMVNF